MKNRFLLLITTILTIIIFHHLMVLLHEWSHSCIGWLFGYKEGPFDIFYGDWTLFHAEEDIDYEPIFRSATPWKGSLIAVAALITNISLYLLSRWLLKKKSVRQIPLVAQAIFWFSVFNLAELYSYMPLRAFSLGGDVGHFETGLSISPWIGFLIGTPLIIWQLIVFFKQELPFILFILNLTSRLSQVLYASLVASIIFGLYGSAPLFYYGPFAVETRWSLFSAVVWLSVTVILSGKYFSGSLGVGGSPATGSTSRR